MGRAGLSRTQEPGAHKRAPPAQVLRNLVLLSQAHKRKMHLKPNQPQTTSIWEASVTGGQLLMLALGQLSPAISL